MAAGRCGTVVASVLVLACAWQISGCGESSSHGSSSAGASSSGAPSAGSGGPTNDGGTVSTGAAAGGGGRAPVGGSGATSGSGDAGRGIAGGTGGGTASGGASGGSMASSGATGGSSDQGGTGGTGMPAAGAGGAIAGTGGTAGEGGTAGAPDFDCPELGLCYVDCTITDRCVRRCKLDSYMFSSNEAVAQLAALKCEMIDNALIVFGDVTSLAGLETIRIANSQISLDVPEIDDISGLSGLETVEYLALAGLAVTEIELPALEEVGADLRIVSLGSVQRILLPKLTTVGGDCDINGTSANEIDLDALEHVGKNLRIFSHPHLTTLNELPSLIGAGSLEIAMNDDFPQCEADAIAARLSLTCDLCTGNSEDCP